MSKVEYLMWYCECDKSLHLVTYLLVQKGSSS